MAGVPKKGVHGDQSNNKDTDYVMEIIETTQKNAISICDHFEMKRRELAVAAERKEHLMIKENELTATRTLLEKVVGALHVSAHDLRMEVLERIFVINEELMQVRGEIAVIRIVHGF